MMKQFGKITALFAVVAMALVFLGQGADAATLDIYWQKQTTGKAAYWILNSNGNLANNTQGEGWNYVDDNAIGTAWRAEMIQDVAGTSNRHLLYHNTTNGKVAFWILNSNGQLKARTQSEGWDYMSDNTMSTAWSMVQIISSSYIKGGNSGMDRLLWFKSSNGKVAYWNLNSNGKIENYTQGEGWGYVDDDLTLRNWRFTEAVEHVE